MLTCLWPFNRSLFKQDITLTALFLTACAVFLIVLCVLCPELYCVGQIHEHQEATEQLKTEKSQLETKLQFQERRLMEVPRMEEQYQRNARGIVRQQEVANTLKEIGWKKLEGEVKSMNFWKSKANALEEVVSRQKLELDNLNAQGRLNLSRYQSLLLSYQTLKRSNPHADFTMHNVMVNSRPSTAGGNAGTGRSTTTGIAGTY